MYRYPLLSALAVPVFFWIIPAISAQAPPAAPRTQVRFAGPSGMQIRWLVAMPDGKVSFSEKPLEAPGRCNFLQGATYRLKLSQIPGFPGLEVYPTLEIPTASPAARHYLAHNAVQLELTAADFQQVRDGKYVVKTVHQAIGGSSANAGPPLLVLRLGNLDLEGPGVPGTK